jgi:hypothetical protein
VTIEAASLGWTSEAFAIHPVMARRRSGETVSFVTRSFRTACVSLALKATTFGPALKSVTLVATAFWRASKAFAIETAAWGRTIETAAFVAATFGAAGETAIVATAAFEAWTHRWARRPASFETRVSGRTSRSTTFESRSVGTSRSAGPPHVLTDGLGHLHELVFAELAVVVFVKLREHLGWVWRVRATAAFRATSTSPAVFAGLAATASAAHFVHFFARFGAFFVV